MAKGTRKTSSGRSVGRPRDAFSERIQVRMSEKELTDWLRVSATEGHNLSSWLRMLANAAVRAQKK
jgi:hypothetical protein